MSDTRDPDRDQQAPAHTDGPAIADLVIADIQERKQHGIRKYGTPLQANNGRSMLRDAYEEVLDLANYLRGALEEGQTAAGLAAGQPIPPIPPKLPLGHCDAPIVVVPSWRDCVTVTCQGNRVGSRLWTSAGAATLADILEQAQRHREECQAGPYKP